MKKEVMIRLSKSFEDCVHMDDGVEYWMARDIQELLEYNEWRNFVNVIDKAKLSCQKSGHFPDDHFVDVNKMVSLGSGVTSTLYNFVAAPPRESLANFSFLCS